MTSWAEPGEDPGDPLGGAHGCPGGSAAGPGEPPGGIPGPAAGSQMVEGGPVEASKGSVLDRKSDGRSGSLPSSCCARAPSATATARRGGGGSMSRMTWSAELLVSMIQLLPRFEWRVPDFRDAVVLLKPSSTGMLRCSSVVASVGGAGYACCACWGSWASSSSDTPPSNDSSRTMPRDKRMLAAYAAAATPIISSRLSCNCSWCPANAWRSACRCDNFVSRFCKGSSGGVVTSS